MQAAIFAAIAALSLSAGSVYADSLSDNPPKSMTICLDGAGHQAAVHCRTQDASRLDAREDVCICPGATRMVKAPVCGSGVHPPAESAAYEQARLKAVSHGALDGASWQGQPMCVAARNAH
jgi:hypothetical protein